MKVRLTILLLFVLSVWVVFISFKPISMKGDRNPSSKEISDLVYHLNLLREQIENGEEVKRAFLQSRKSYKVFEWKLEYLSYSWQEFFNGTPSAKINEQAAGIYKKPPHGFQYLEELICENADRDKILKEVNLLIKESSRVQEYLNQSELNQLQIIEALQLALIRWQTLTIVGFENPCLSLSYSMDEAVVVLDVLKKLVITESGRNKSFNKKESKSIVSELDEIQVLVKNASFEDLDRYEILVNLLPQVNALLIKAKEKFSAIESNWTVNSPINLNASNVFDKSFVNPDFFSSFGRNKSNPTIESLGKAIFFDPALSKNNQLSCATCHQPDKYFADGLVKSISSKANQFLARNTPTLLYSGYQSRWMFSMQSLFLENQMDHVVVNHKEFETSYTEMIEKLKQNEEYVAMFSKAFPELGEQAISVYSLNLTVAAYVRSLAPFNSDFDKYVYNPRVVDESVKNGFNLFAGKAKCVTCPFYSFV
jgi:cytochrome c peroxidase